eukprot:Skav213970  [mRNA]  locus=scaffold2200:210549:218889:+ [translate_table: standard]
MQARPGGQSEGAIITEEPRQGYHIIIHDYAVRGCAASDSTQVKRRQPRSDGSLPGLPGGEVPKGRFACGQCGFVGSSRLSLSMHMTQAHRPQKAVRSRWPGLAMRWFAFEPDGVEELELLAKLLLPGGWRLTMLVRCVVVEAAPEGDEEGQGEGGQEEEPPEDDPVVDAEAEEEPEEDIDALLEGLAELQNFPAAADAIEAQDWNACVPGDPQAEAGLMVLQEDMRVRLTRNLDKDRGFVNGNIGTIKKMLRRDVFILESTRGVWVCHNNETCSGIHLRLGWSLLRPTKSGYAYVGVSRGKAKQDVFLLGNIRRTDWRPVGGDARGGEQETPGPMSYSDSNSCSESPSLESDNSSEEEHRGDSESEDDTAWNKFPPRTREDEMSDSECSEWGIPFGEVEPGTEPIAAQQPDWAGLFD